MITEPVALERSVRATAYESGVILAPALNYFVVQALLQMTDVLIAILDFQQYPSMRHVLGGTV